jgi:glucose/arabinose dehydrogenase
MSACLRTVALPSMLLSALIIAAPVVGAQGSKPVPLEDPIPLKIVKGDIAVEAIEFVRFPRTHDSSTEALANNAYARIQYMLPIDDDSGRLIINDTRGYLYITDVTGRTPEVYLDLAKEQVGFSDWMNPNEAGLASFAFHPDFAEKGKPGFGKFYTGYSTTSDSGHADYLENDADSHESVIREWTATDPGSDVFTGNSREVFRIGQFFPNHNIGTIAFNPTAKAGTSDYGMLYVCLGDGGAAFDPRDNGQGLSAPQGSIMRINPLEGDEGNRYVIPTDNPFVANPFLDNPAVAPEIWAYGLRHAQQFSWDADGRMFIGDIGQRQIEEINIGVAGANYGWRLREGTFATSYAVPDAIIGPVYTLPNDDDENFVYPIAQYDHDEGSAVSGGFVYRGNGMPALQGKYIFTDLVLGRIFYFDADALIPGRPAAISELSLKIKGREVALMDIAGYPNTYTTGDRVDLRLGIDDKGELYLLTKGDGWIRKLVPVSVPVK